jgi:hypothetical protein
MDGQPMFCRMFAAGQCFCLFLGGAVLERKGGYPAFALFIETKRDAAGNWDYCGSICI